MSKEPSLYPSHSRARRYFLSISGLGAVVALGLAHSVLLPFLLAMLVAYVLFPVVRRLESRRLPRWGAILLVYVFTVGGTAGFLWSVVPTLFDEVKSLASDLPAITQRMRDEVLPKIDLRLQKWSHSESNQSRATDVNSTKDGPPSMLITPRAEGGFEVRLKESLQFKPGTDGSWVLGPHEETKRAFSSERALRDAFDRSLALLQTHSAELVQAGRQVLGSISRAIFFFFITLMLAAYLMITWEAIQSFFRELFPAEERRSFDRFLRRVDRSLAGVVRGQLLICLVNGGLTAVGLWLFHLKYWPVISLVAGALSIIPIFGSFLSTVPAVAIALTQSPGIALGVFFWIVGIHQLEANFLNPKIIGDQAKIHPVLVVFALLLGESLFSITGALLAVPCLALVQSVFMHFRESVLGIPDPSLPSDEPPAGPDDVASPADVQPGSTAAPVV